MLLVVFTLSLVAGTSLGTISCPQLGCDSAGSFTQDEFVIPITPSNQRKLVWKTDKVRTARMTDENENYGCVASQRLVACPFYDRDLGARPMLLDPRSGKQSTQLKAQVLQNITMPILTKNSTVLTVNSTHISLLDPFQDESVILKLPRAFAQGAHSPIYFPKLDVYVVSGNLSESMYMYRASQTDTAPELELLAAFQVEKLNSTCPWLPVTELAAYGERLYFYGVHVSEATALVAVDVLPEPPYMIKAWELSDEVSVTIQRNRQSGVSANKCSYDLEPTEDTEGFPPVDVQIQLVATPDKHLVFTAAFGMFLFEDKGDSGSQIGGMLFGAHFLAIDEGVHQQPPVVWMTGWQLYPPFRSSIFGWNYTDVESTDSITYLMLSTELGMADLNVTSRITSFIDPSGKSRILVFGISAATLNKNAVYHSQHCENCEVGLQKAVIALRVEYSATAEPDILWIYPLPDSDMEVRGQIVGAAESLIMYVSNDETGYVLAIS